MKTGDFNTRSLNWWSLDKKNHEGREINSLTSVCGYSEIINEPTQMTGVSSSCIDLIFTASPNLISNTGVDPHSITSTSVGIIKMIIKVWYYKNADSSYIQSAVSNTDWEFLFRGTDVNKKVDISNECLKNIFHNFIPTE